LGTVESVAIWTKDDLMADSLSGMAGAAHMDALVGEECASATELAVVGEGVPSVGKVLVVDQITETPEGALALDGPLQLCPQPSLSRPLTAAADEFRAPPSGRSCPARRRSDASSRR
jgi:hypothetical protein